MRQRGFTLVEILVALAVLVSAVVVLSDALGGAARNYSRLEEKTQAWQVASDKLVELQVYQQWPGTGTDDSRVERFGVQWLVRTRISGGPFPDTRRVDIDVGPAPEGNEDWAVFYSLASLLGKPAE